MHTVFQNTPAKSSPAKTNVKVVHQQAALFISSFAGFVVIFVGSHLVLKMKNRI
jgi:hypothetical protein